MFPTKQQLEQKWWHRFFRVILIASTITWLFIWIAILNNDDVFDWEKSKYVYSFEDDFNEYTGQVDNCSVGYSVVIPYGVFVPYSMSPAEKFQKYATPTKLDCGNLSKINFIDRYCGSVPQDTLCGTVRILDLKTIESIIKQENIRTKYVPYTDWETVFFSIFLLVAGTIGWMVLLKYGIYKAILYVVYGRN